MYIFSKSSYLISCFLSKIINNLNFLEHFASRNPLDNGKKISLLIRSKECFCLWLFRSPVVYVTFADPIVVIVITLFLYKQHHGILSSFLFSAIISVKFFNCFLGVKDFNRNNHRGT